MPQYNSDVAAFYAEKHLTLAERNEAYAAAVSFANDRGTSHKNFLPSEYAGRVAAKGFFVPTAEDRTLPLHCDPRTVAVIQDEHPGTDPWDTPCDGSYAKTESGECAECDRLFCTDSALPMLAEIDGEGECDHTEHCEDCGRSDVHAYNDDMVLCASCAEARETRGLSLVDRGAVRTEG